MEPAMLNSILGKALAAQRAAEAAKKARELVRRKSVLTKSTLPGKLADCQSTDKSESEVFLVEGDSAGQATHLALAAVCTALLLLFCLCKLLSSAGFTPNARTAVHCRAGSAAFVPVASTEQSLICGCEGTGYLNEACAVCLYSAMLLLKSAGAS